MLVVKDAGKDELHIVQSLAVSIWPTAYNGIISNEQIDYMLARMYNPEVLGQQLSEQQRFVILYSSDEPVGFAAFGKKGNDDGAVYRLNKIYLLQSQQGKGSGRFLLNYVIDAVSRLGGTSLELNVNKQNPARHFYSRNGFETIREEVLDIGNGYVMDDYVMSLSI